MISDSEVTFPVFVKYEDPEIGFYPSGSNFWLESGAEEMDFFDEQMCIFDSCGTILNCNIKTKSLETTTEIVQLDDISEWFGSHLAWCKIKNFDFTPFNNTKSLIEAVVSSNTLAFT